MKKGQKEGPRVEKKLMHCYSKDRVEVDVIYACATIIVNNRPYNAFVNPKDARTVGWRDRLISQIERAITYVVKHYRFSIVNDHRSHIERQIKNNLNKNHLEEVNSLPGKGLEIYSIEVLNIDERANSY